ncbi:MAG TPA: hypothetical protein VGB99_16685 [Acidobacteriota bacterium]
MAKDKREQFNRILTAAMERFKASFLLGGGTFYAESVTFRDEITKFDVKPLQVKEYLFAVQYLNPDGSDCIEISVNPDKNIDIEEFQEMVRQRYQPAAFQEVLRRFLSSADGRLLGKSVEELDSWFSINPAQDIRYEIKHKGEKSKRSGEYYDYIIRQRFHLKRRKLKTLLDNEESFTVGVYYYCLKCFSALFAEFMRSAKG